MGYDRRDSVPFDFEPNEIPFGTTSKGKLSPRSYPIQFERKRKQSFFSDNLFQITDLYFEGHILNQMEFHLVQNRKENCHHDHIPFNVKGIGNIDLSAKLKLNCSIS